MAKLKIQHTRTGAPGYENSATIVEDSRVTPTQVSGNYIGGTGGLTDQTIETIQPSVKVRSETATTGSILTQKGLRKFLVSDENTVADESIVAGQQYRILSVGTTDWESVGAGPNATTNDIFVAKAAGAGSGTVQNVSTCTLVNLLGSELTTANSMCILVTATEIAGANVANIGPGERTSAYITFVTGNVTGVSSPVIGYQISGTSLTGNVTITAINATGNITVSCEDQGVSNEQVDIDVTFNASRITNKYVYDWPADSSDVPTKYRYWFAAPSSSGSVLSSQPEWQGTTFVKVNNA